MITQVSFAIHPLGTGGLRLSLICQDAGFIAHFAEGDRKFCTAVHRIGEKHSPPNIPRSLGEP